VTKARPENHGDRSFPSGHTAVSFQGAAFIHRRYGWEYSIPAYLGAAYVAWSRIEGEADKHDIVDVSAGAAIGILSSYFFTARCNGSSVALTAGQGTYGLSIAKEW